MFRKRVEGIGVERCLGEGRGLWSRKVLRRRGRTLGQEGFTKREDAEKGL